MTALDRAFLVASKAHSNQFYGIYPYVYHVLEVATIAKDLKLSETVQVACVLHDALEDSDLSYNDIKKEFGMEVAEIVYAVTDELGRNRKERKEKTYPKIRPNSDAILVKLCDRIANVRNSKKSNQDMFDVYAMEQSEFMIALFPETVMNAPEDHQRVMAVLIDEFKTTNEFHHA